MKIIVFGATGTLGQEVVKSLLDKGHAVTAFARSPGKLNLDHAHLTHIAGDAMKEDDVTRAVGGHDAVVVTLGAGMDRKSRIRSQGTLNVIRAMQATGVKRLIAQSTLGARESWSNLNFFWKRIMFGGIIASVFRDHELQEQLIEASGLDWTIVRPSAFADGPATGRFIEDVPPTERRLRLKITRADIASFIARQLGDLRYLHRAVGIST